jgi:hypothetical protein
MRDINIKYKDLQGAEYFNVFFLIALDTNNYELLDITAPRVTRILVAPTKQTQFVMNAFARLAVLGFPITKIPCYKCEVFQQTLLRHVTYTLPLRRDIAPGNKYNVSFLNIENIYHFEKSQALSQCVNLFVAVHFERYKYTVILTMIYWLLLIMVPSLVTPVMAILQIDTLILIVCRFVFFIVYFIIFGLYYRFCVIVCVPIILNVCSLYCTALCIDAVLLETLFVCYVVYWYFAFAMYASNKIRFIREARPNGRFILNYSDIKYIFLGANGTVQVSVDNILYFKVLQINNIPINV